MKSNLHPNWHHDCIVTCSCGSSFTTGSTMKTIQLDICNACHPFFTGEMKFVDRQGRVDKFMQKMKVAQQKQTSKAKKKSKKSDDDQQQSYQQILRDQKAKIRQAASDDASSDKKSAKTDK